MKKKLIYIFGITLLLVAFSACKSSKKGCGLTSDAQKIESGISTNSGISTQAT